MGVELTLDTTVPDLAKALTDLQRKQLPFATALAITTTLKDAQTDLRDELPDRFTIRNNFLEKGIRIRPATKRRLEGSVFTVDEILRLQIEGGTKGGRGHRLALPRSVKTNARGIVTRANRPRNLRSKSKHFLAPVRRGGMGLFKRSGKKRYPIVLLWRLLDGSARIDSRFDFDRIANRSIDKHWNKNFGRALAKALSTAR